MIKKLIIYLLLKKKRFYSLPNIIQKKEIVPELLGKLTIEEIAESGNSWAYQRKDG